MHFIGLFGIKLKFHIKTKGKLYFSSHYECLTRKRNRREYLVLSQEIITKSIYTKIEHLTSTLLISVMFNVNKGFKHP